MSAVRSGARDPAAENRRLDLHDQPPAIWTAAARRQYADRQSGSAVAGRLLRFRRRPIRISTSAANMPMFNPDQRRSAPRRRFRARPGAGHQLYRQPVAADRHAAGPIRAAHRRRPRHHQPKLFRPRAADVSLYGGSRETFTPSFDYGGSIGNTQYFVTGRGNWNNLGIENPTPRSTPSTIRPIKASSSATFDAARRIRRGLA